MKNFLPAIFILITIAVYAQQDTANCNDNPVFGFRMAEYFISECRTEITKTEFFLKPDLSQSEFVNGKVYSTKFKFNSQSGKQKPNTWLILKSYEDAVIKGGGVIVMKNLDQGIGTFRLQKEGKTVAWIHVETGGKDDTEYYDLVVVKVESK